MGTRADFYLGRGLEAEWLGSIAWDGHPMQMPVGLLRATDEAGFRSSVTDLLLPRDARTLPDDGWPWPWEDSGTSDFAYAFDAGIVWTSCFGCEWMVAADITGRDDVWPPGAMVFPNMKSRQRVVRSGPRSGLIIFARRP